MFFNNMEEEREEAEDERKEDQFFCESCGKEIIKKEYNTYAGLCKLCFEREDKYPHAMERLRNQE